MITIYALSIFFSLCSASFAAQGSGALRLVKDKEIPVFADDGHWGELGDSIDQSLQYYAAFPSSATLSFGGAVLTVEKARQGLERFRKILQESKNSEQLNQRIRKDFNVYHVRIGGKAGQVTFSSYFAPSIQAKLRSDSEYRYPFYTRPPDLLDLYWEDFDPARKGERMAGRIDGKKLVPYFTREDIDSKKVLAGKGLEIAWAKNPLDVLTLQIQGSGWIMVPGSTESYHIRYAGDNGRKYQSVGLRIIEMGAIPKPEFNKTRMWNYLDSIAPERRQEILNYNPRYIFFEITSATTQVRGSLMVSLTDGRSIATDPKIYPPGGLAFIKTQKPVFDADLKPAGVAELSRFVLNQDEGGAIKGWNRVDYYSGHGPLAEKFAERLWFPGELYFFTLK